MATPAPQWTRRRASAAPIALFWKAKRSRAMLAHDQERPVGVKFQTVLLVTQEGGKISHENKWREL